MRLCSVNAFSALREMIPLDKRVFAFGGDVFVLKTRFLPLRATFQLDKHIFAFAIDVCVFVKAFLS